MRSEPAESGRFLPRWAIFVMIPGFLGPALILAFIFVTELAHDEARCPYQPRVTRLLTDTIAVREDRRSCIWDIEERRFTVIRDKQERALGRRRFRSEAFAPGQYTWQAELGSGDEVHVHVHNPGHDDAAFREGTRSERGH